MTKHETVDMPGDGDEDIDRAKASGVDSPESGMPVDDAKKARTQRKKFEGASAKDAAEAKDQAERGNLTPAQVEGDGWLDTPAQMRE